MGAIAEQGKTGEKPAEKKSAAMVLRDTIDSQLPQYQQVMPAGWNAERFGGLVYAAIRTTPGLMECLAHPLGRMSLMGSAMEAAGLGLEPNTPLHLATIVPRKTKKKIDGQWVEYKSAQLMIEYRGFVQLMKRSGDVEAIRAGVVREKDMFDYDLGEGWVKHKLYDGDEDPGQLSHCWAKAVHPNGSETLVVLPRRIVYAQHRAKSDSFKYDDNGKSPWNSDEEAMWLKTALRVLSKLVVMTPEVARSFAMVEPSEVVLSADGGSLDVVDDSDIVDAEVVE